MFAVYDDNNPYALNKLASTRNFTHFEYQIMHVRDPRNSIPSIVTENKYPATSFRFRRRHILKILNVDIEAFNSEIEMAIASLVYWTIIIENQKPTFVFRIEDQTEDLI